MTESASLNNNVIIILLFYIYTARWKFTPDQGGKSSPNTHDAQFAFALGIARTNTPFLGPNVSVDLSCSGSYTCTKSWTPFHSTSEWKPNEHHFLWKVKRPFRTEVQSMHWFWMPLQHFPQKSKSTTYLQAEYLAPSKHKFNESGRFVISLLIIPADKIKAQNHKNVSFCGFKCHVCAWQDFAADIVFASICQLVMRASWCEIDCSHILLST